MRHTLSTMAVERASALKNDKQREVADLDYIMAIKSDKLPPRNDAVVHHYKAAVNRQTQRRHARAIASGFESNQGIRKGHRIAFTAGGPSIEGRYARVTGSRRINGRKALDIVFENPLPTDSPGGFPQGVPESVVRLVHSQAPGVHPADAGRTPLDASAPGGCTHVDPVALCSAIWAALEGDLSEAELLALVTTALAP